MFNPSHAAQHLDPNGVDALYDIKPLRYHKIMITGMKSVVHAYLTACVWASWSTRRAWRPSPTTSCSSGAAQRQQVPDAGGRRALHVRHDAKLGER